MCSALAKQNAIVQFSDVNRPDLVSPPRLAKRADFGQDPVTDDNCYASGNILVIRHK